MPFLSTQTFRALALKKKIITPFVPDRITHGAYELSLGAEAYVTSDLVKTHLVARSKDLYSQISIEPGQFAMLLTEEIVDIPDDCIGFISIRAKWKVRGLVNVSGFHVDPGYKGRLKYAVYNAAGNPITLTRGEKIFPLWLARMDASTEDPYREGDIYEQNQRNLITSSDIDKINGDMASPSQLREDLDEIKTEIGIYKTILTGLFASVIILFIKLILDSQ